MGNETQTTAPPQDVMLREVVQQHMTLLASLIAKVDTIAVNQDKLHQELREDFGKIYFKLDNHSERIISSEGDVKRLLEDKKALYAILTAIGAAALTLATKFFGGK